MSTKNVVRLQDALRTLATDPVTANDPIKRMFLCDGQYVSANVSILNDTGDAIHIQSSHDELVLIIEGECGFRVGDESKRVQAGDLIFIPKDHPRSHHRQWPHCSIVDIRAVLRPVQQGPNSGQVHIYQASLQACPAWADERRAEEQPRSVL